MKRRKTALCCLLICLNLLFIWGNSLLPGETSGAISGGIMEWLRSVLGEIVTWGELLLRKLGHFTEFACLGVLLAWLFQILEQKGIHQFTMPLLCGMLAACTDETIQVFVPDRGPSVIDVWIDTAGVCTGMILLLMGHALLMMKKRKNNMILEETKT